MHIAVMAALAFSALGGSAAAQDPVAGSVTPISGKCSSLAVVGQDITADCAGTLLLGTDADGRMIVGFLVTRGPGAIYFSGREEARDGVAVLRVDRIILVGPGDPKDTVILGAGECRWGDFSTGAARIICQFVAEDGTPATGAFETDGVAPGAIQP